MGYSNIGKIYLRGCAALYVVNIVVVALSAHVNHFMDFFYIADLFPFALSIATLVLLSALFLLDLRMRNVITSRAPFEIGLLTVLTILWLASNAFSTSRWRFVPLACSTIPDGFPSERSWCRNLQALKAFIWIEWVILILLTAYVLRYTITEHLRGNKHIWQTALSRYTPHADGGMHHRTSSFFTGFGDANGFVIRDNERDQSGFANLGRGN